MILKKPTVSLKIGGVPEHFNLPWRLAIGSGSLKKYGIEANWQEFHSGTGAMVQALNNGDVDVATLLTEGAIKASAQEDCEFELYSFYTKSPLIWGVHTPIETDIKSLKDLNKATFAISRYGSGSNLMAYLLAESQGLSVENLKFEIINNLDGANKLFQKGGNYVFLWEKFMTKPLVDSGQMLRISDFPTPWSCFVTCVRKEVLTKHPKQIKQMMKSVLKTSKQMQKSPIAEQLIAEQYQLELADVKTWLKSTKWHKKISLDQKLIDEVRGKLKQLGIV